MQNGICIKCRAETVYRSDASYPQSGLKTDSGYPYLSIHKENRWIPDLHHSRMVSYVCRSCGYYEMFVRDLSVLARLDDCDNWQKIEVV